MILSSGNLVCFLVCYRKAAGAPDFQGLGAALLSSLSLFLSALLSGFALNAMISEFRTGKPTARAVIATLLAVAPLIIFLSRVERLSPKPLNHGRGLLKILLPKQGICDQMISSCRMATDERCLRCPMLFEIGIRSLRLVALISSVGSDTTLMPLRPT